MGPGRGVSCPGPAPTHSEVRHSPDLCSVLEAGCWTVLPVCIDSVWVVRPCCWNGPVPGLCRIPRMGYVRKGEKEDPRLAQVSRQIHLCANTCRLDIGRSESNRMEELSGHRS